MVVIAEGAPEVATVVVSVTVGIGPASTEMELVTVALASVATVTELADEVSGMVGAVMASGGGVTVTVHIRKIRGKTRRAVCVCVCVCACMCVCVCVCVSLCDDVTLLKAEERPRQKLLLHTQVQLKQHCEGAPHFVTPLCR